MTKTTLYTEPKILILGPIQKAYPPPLKEKAKLANFSLYAIKNPHAVYGHITLNMLDLV